MKKNLLLGVVFLFCFLSACFSENSPTSKLTTDTWSTNIEDYAEKIAFFKQYVTCPTDVLDVEYHIEFHNNSGIPPGPSDWKVSAAIQVEKSDIAAWTADMTAVTEETIDTAWWRGLDIQEWALTDAPVYYKRAEEQSYLAVYEEQGILLKYFYAN
ncbi:MAG: hypothetical protein LBU77_00960 [Clostridiales bacterium]|nr:hypothetical protein [Clostridiales bacterium]